MVDIDAGLDRLGELAGELYDAAQIDNRIAEAIETVRDVAHDLRRGLTGLMADLGGIDDDEDGPEPDRVDDDGPGPGPEPEPEPEPDFGPEPDPLNPVPTEDQP